MTTQDRIVWHDLDPQASELWVIEAPASADRTELRAASESGALPIGWRWIDSDEWDRRHEQMEIVEHGK